MAAAVRERRISPVELVEAHLAQIERVNPKINAFVRVLGEEAREAARHLTNAVLPDEGQQPLFGVPVTIKDSFDVAGLPTLCGSRLREGHVAAEDATAVARLRAAGAIILGKTNCPEFAGSYESDNFVTGQSNNPWDVERTPGGSSGGEAAAIAARCSPGGLGSDGGGSIRVPAHFCGIAGMRPTLHRIPLTGHYPPPLLPVSLMTSAGPMARTARDLRLLCRVMQGEDDQDSLSARVKWEDHPRVDRSRVGVMEQFFRVPVVGAVREAIQRAAGLLRELGFAVDPVEVPALERAPNLWAFFFGDLAAPAARERLKGRESGAHWTALEYLRDEPPPSAEAIVEAFAARDRLRAQLLGQMRSVPFLLLPVSSIPAFRHRERRWDVEGKSINLFQAMLASTAFNLFGLPAVTIPFGKTGEGLPVGVQLVGRPWEDEAVLELAVRLEEARGPFAGPALHWE